MTIQELIDRLEQIENKTMDVMVENYQDHRDIVFIKETDENKKGIVCLCIVASGILC